MLVNMDETAVFFETRPPSTVHPTGSRTVPARALGSNIARLTACVSIARDGTKVSLFLIYKCKANGRFEKSLNDILPDNIFGCCQEKGWMDDRSIHLWLEILWKPYISEFGHSFLMLDNFVFHKSPKIVEQANKVGTAVETIHGGYKCVL